MKLLLWTKDDPASGRIAGSLVRLGHFAQAGQNPHVRFDPTAKAALVEIEGSLLAADHADKTAAKMAGADFESALFLSKHSAASAIPTLTVHPIGNLTTEAKFGGAPSTLAPADPLAMTRLLGALIKESKKLEVPASFEATHHGPVMTIPSLFVEVGSSQREWEHEGSCLAVATAVSQGYLAPAERAYAPPTAIGVGGGHYHPFQTDIARKESVPVAHLIPNHALEAGGEAVVDLALAQSGAKGVLFDSRKMGRAERGEWLGRFERRGLAIREVGHWGPP